MWWKKRQDGDADRLETLSRRLDDVESAFRKLRGEWTDTEERVSRIAGRLAKRAARDLDRLEPPPGGGEPAAAPEPLDEVAMRRQRRTFPGGG